MGSHAFVPKISIANDRSPLWAPASDKTSSLAPKYQSLVIKLNR